MDTVNHVGSIKFWDDAAWILVVQSMTGFDSKRQAAMDKLVEIQEEFGMYDDQKPAQEPVAIHQHRIPYCADWYDGIPDHHDGHGPYEVRTLYTTPRKREWVGLTAKEKHEFRYSHMTTADFIEDIEAKLKEKNA